MQSGTKPLDGIRVLDLTANVAGPSACQVLRDLGAEVVKVEPDAGEAARRITATAGGAEHLTPYFTPHNRGKKSVRIELGSPEGAAALRELISTSDVLVQGMRPGTLDRKGFGVANVAEINPRCIYASVSAYGGGSDLEDRPGVDMLVQAEAGCMSGQPADRPPRTIPFQLVDGATGHVLAQAVLAALLHRERFGAVGAVSVSMYDVACHLQANHLSLQMNTAPAPPAPDRAPARRAVAVEPSGVYPTADRPIVLAAYVPGHWRRLIEMLDRPDLAADPRFAGQAARSLHATELRAVLTEILEKEPAATWIPRFQRAGLMASEITTWAEVVDSEIFRRRGLRLAAEQDGLTVDVLRTPALYSAFETTQERVVPELGADNAVLLGSLGPETAGARSS